MKFLRNAIFISLFLLTAACTSSNSVSNQSTNNNYDREFREQTRSTTNNYEQGKQLDEDADGDPIVSVMLVALETGDVHPGDDYYVYAVVDSPRERDDIEYVWSIENGDIHEVEESERGRLETLVETEYATASAGGSAPAEPVDPAGVIPGEAGKGDGPVTLGGGTTQPMGSGAPSTFGGGSRASGGGAPVQVPQDTLSSPDARMEEEMGQMSAEERAAFEESMGVKSGSNGTSSDGKEEEGDSKLPEVEEGAEKKDEKTDSTEGKDESEKTEPKKEESGKVGFVLERRVLAAPDEEPQPDDNEETEEIIEPEGTDSEELPVDGESDSDVQDAAARVAGLITQTRPIVAAESTGSTEASSFGSVDEPVLNDGGNTLRYEYETWKEDGNEKNRRPLAGYGSGRESERITWEESCEDCMVITDDPYILWTPEIPGETSIYVQVRYKNDILTDPVELPVSIRLKDPAVTLSEDFPDVVREDESVYLELNAENIPAFDKGLFTIQFDPYKLSFRDAELGEFFDDSPASSIYFAQPDKMQGKVLVAVDTNTNILDLSGDGVLAYIKFKAKEDLSEREETGLMLVADTSARYVLNKDGENVLPLPVQNPAFRTSTVMPPMQPEFERENTPGTEAPAQTGSTQPRPGGNSPAGVQTYGTGTGAAPLGSQPPANTGTQPPAGGNQNPGGINPNTPPVDVVPPPESSGGPVESGSGLRRNSWMADGLPTGYYSTTSGTGDSEWLVGRYSGSGKMNSEYFILSPGISIFTFDLESAGQATAVLKDINGNSVGRLFNSEYPKGSRAMGIQTEGEYMLEVDSYGDWEIACWQPRVEGASEERSFKGEMTAATVFTSLPAGVNYFRMSHQGTANFTVLLLNYDGVPIKTLVSTAGNYDDVVEFDLPESGMYVLDVIAFSHWEITIE